MYCLFANLDNGPDKKKWFSTKRRGSKRNKNVDRLLLEIEATAHKQEPDTC
jgi:hypothetical protein